MVKKRGGGRPRLEDVYKTQEWIKPWLLEDPPMSKSTWNRRRRERAIKNCVECQKSLLKGGGLCPEHFVRRKKKETA
jgi:hypothetical protein